MDERLLLSLELDLTEEPITGRLAVTWHHGVMGHPGDHRGEVRPFSGWIALASAIEEARTEAMSGSAPVGDSRRGEGAGG